MTAPPLRHLARLAVLAVLAACPVAAGCAVDPVAEPRLEPGQFDSPLVQLMRIRGKNQHMHIDEVRWRAEDNRVFVCSYTFAALNVSNPADPKYLVEELKHTVIEDGKERKAGCIHLAWDHDVVYTTHRGNLSNPTFVSGWQFTDLPKGVTVTQLPVLQEEGESYEGIDVGPDGTVFIALRQNGVGAYQRDPATQQLSRIGTLGGLGSTWGLRVRGSTVFVTDLAGALHTVDVGNPKAMKHLGSASTGGTANGVVVDGAHAYVAAGPAGLVVVDIADLAKPKVVAQVDTRGSAVRVDFAEGHVFVAAWNDSRVYDVQDPTKPKFVGAVRLTNEMAHPDDSHPPVTARTLGIAARGRDIFVGNWWVPYTFRLYPERKAPNLVVTEEANLVDFGPTEPGKTRTVQFAVRNQGTAPLTLFNIWASSDVFSVEPDELRLQEGEAAKLTVTFTPTTMAKEKGLLHLFSDDPLQPLRTAFLTGNQPGVGVGKPLPETQLTLLDGSAWSSADVQNKPLVMAYFATF